MNLSLARSNWNYIGVRILHYRHSFYAFVQNEKSNYSVFPKFQDSLIDPKMGD